MAGADLTALRQLNDTKSARAIAKLGRDVFDILAGMEVPTFAFINGTAIGGGLEIALAADYRTISEGVAAISLPEAFLGLVPGWGGVHRLPRLIGPQNSVLVMIENALSNNKTLDGRTAFELGIADTILEPTDFVAESLAWAARTILDEDAQRQCLQERRTQKATAEHADWDEALARGRRVVAIKTADAAPAPMRLLDLLERGETLTEPDSAELEIQALTELIMTPQFKDSTYAFLDLIQRRSRKPFGAPKLGVVSPITKVGVIGAARTAVRLAADHGCWPGWPGPRPG